MNNFNSSYPKLTDLEYLVYADEMDAWLAEVEMAAAYRALTASRYEDRTPYEMIVSRIAA